MSYAYCTDTRALSNPNTYFSDPDILYHESTFLDQHENLAAITGHSTARQAAQIAKQANVKKLLLGHYSTRYDNIESFKEEASQIFENVELAEDSKILEF